MSTPHGPDPAAGREPDPQAQHGRNPLVGGMVLGLIIVLAIFVVIAVIV